MWQRISALLILVAVTIMQPLLAVAQQTTKPDAPQLPQWPSGHGHWHMWGGNPGWHFWWMPLMMIIFFVLFFLAMRYFHFDRGWGPMHRWPHGSNSSAIDILNERFAKGEINEDEYKDKKAKILST